MVGIFWGLHFSYLRTVTACWSWNLFLLPSPQDVVYSPTTNNITNTYHHHLHHQTARSSFSPPFRIFLFEKIATDPRSSRESRFDARKQRRFVRWSSPSTRSVAGGWWWSSLVTQLLVTIERWGYRNHMGQWDWFLKIYSIWYITVLEDCNYQLTCYKSGRQICMYINIYIYTICTYSVPLLPEPWSFWDMWYVWLHWAKTNKQKPLCLQCLSFELILG